MKKVFNSLLVIIAAMVTFAGCAKQETDAPATPETKTVQFFANSIETKTHFGDKNDDGKYPTLWDAKDRVKVLLNLESPSNVKGLETIADIEVSEDSKSARFNAEINSEYPFNSYTFYAISPSSAYNAKSSNDGRFTVQIPNKQAPQPASVDKAAQVLYSISATTNEFQSSVQMHFKHFTAYGKLSLINLTDEISQISSVKLSFPVNVVGKWNYFVADGRIEAKEAISEIELTTTSTDGIWFACAPVDVSGKTITLTVTTDKGNLVKEITFPANRKFEAGKISKFTVDMTGIGVEQPEDTEWVSTAFADIKAGDQVVIVSTKSASIYALPHNNGSSSAPGVVDVTYSNNKLTKEPAETVIWTVSKSGANYIFHPSGDTSQWLYCTNANNGVRVGTNSNKNFVMDTASGYLKNVETSRYLGVYNNQDWRCYTNTTGNTAGQTFQFFVKSGSGSETPEQPKALVSIAVAGQTTTYTVGDTFEFDGTVTATYDDESIATVTPTSVSEPNMNTVGTQDITVSYTEGEVTAETTYTITVNEAPAGPIVATIEEFLDAEDSETVWYQLTGTISSISNTMYGNFDLTDETGTVYVYGLKKSKDAGNQTFSELGLREGDTVTLIGNRYTFVNQNNSFEKDEVTNAYYVSHVPAPYLTVSSEAISVASTATSAEFTVDANVEWTVSCSTATATKSDNKVTVAFEANETAEAVVYEVVVNSELGEHTVTITQAAASQGGGDVVTGGSETFDLRYSATDVKSADWSISQNNVSLYWSKGTASNTPSPNKEGSVRMYTNTTLTIAAPQGTKISRVVFTTMSNSYSATNLKYNGSKLTSEDWTLSVPENTIVLTASANVRIKEIVVYYN